MSQDILVPASDWGEASTGPEDADPLPSCTGAIGFKSMWYRVSVPEAAVLRVSVISTDTARYQPVVTILAPGGQDEVACGVLAVGKAGATATATAYVTPNAVDGTAADYLVRVAQVTLQSPIGRAADADRALRRARRDATAHPRELPADRRAEHARRPTTRMTRATTGSGIDPTTAHWEFYDKSKTIPCDERREAAIRATSGRSRARTRSSSPSRIARAT